MGLEHIAAKGAIPNNAVRAYIQLLQEKATSTDFYADEKHAYLSIDDLFLELTPFAIQKEDTVHLLSSEVINLLGIDSWNINDPHALEAAITVMGSPMTIYAHATHTYYMAHITLPAEDRIVYTLAQSILNPSDTTNLRSLVEKSFYLNQDALLFSQATTAPLFSRSTVIGTINDGIFRWKYSPTRRIIVNYALEHNIPILLSNNVPLETMRNLCAFEAALSITNHNFYHIDESQVLLCSIKLPDATPNIISTVIQQPYPGFINYDAAVENYKIMRTTQYNDPALS